MKRTVELNTGEIADRLNDLKQLASVIAVAVVGIHGDRELSDGISQLAYELGERIEEISEAIHPEPDELQS
jgi:hypothetical protein